MSDTAQPLRFARERFTRALVAMCEQLDAGPVRVFDYRSPSSTTPYLQIQGNIEARVAALWAFGSWARGAATCGDLDLVAHIEGRWTAPPCRAWSGQPLRQDQRPPFEAMRKVLLGSRPHVHVLDWRPIADPKSEFTVRPEDLTLIWRAPADGEPAHDWRAAIDAILVRPDAGRAPRLLDALPLLIEQTAMDLPNAERAALAHQQGLLAWEFRPHGRTRHEPASLVAGEASFALELSMGCRDRALVERALQATRDVRRRFRSRTRYWFGPCGIWATMFERRDASAFVITPKWTQRGPNGSLVVTRGPAYTAKRAERFEREHRGF